MRFLLISCLVMLGFGQALFAQNIHVGETAGPAADFERIKPMDLPCVSVTATLNEEGTGETPWFRLYHDGRVAAVTSANVELTLQVWDDGAWVSVTSAAAKDGAAVADVLASAGYYRWLVQGTDAGDLVPLCMQMPIDNLITDFTGPDAEAADAAYFALFQLGEGAIPLLLNLTGLQGKYAGGNLQSPSSSYLELEAPDMRCVALYLIDAIFWDNPRPHMRLDVLGVSDLDTKTRLDRAVDSYQRWWLSNQGLSLKQLRTKDHPLAETGLYWLGPVQDHDALHHKEPDGNSNKVPGSATPGTNPMICLATGTGPDPTNTDPYEWKLLPGAVGGPTPYNCLAWSLNCQTDRWIQPTAGTSIDDILEDYCYNKPSTEDAECPEGCGPKIKMIFWQPCEPENAPLEWVHAMKQEADGDWSSKNGQSCRYGDIKDCAAFVGCHYPAPEGQKLVIKYYCKKKKETHEGDPDGTGDQTGDTTGGYTTTGGGR